MAVLEWIKIAAVVLVPFLELRASIPYGILVLGKPWPMVFLISIIANIILGLLLYPLIGFIISIVRKIRLLDRLYTYYIEKTQKKIDYMVEKYGEYALALFIGVPLPGSGVYSGSVAAYLIGLSYKKFIIANILGVIIAGVIVTAVVVSGNSAFGLFIKRFG